MEEREQFFASQMAYVDDEYDFFLNEYYRLQRQITRLEKVYKASQRRAKELKAQLEAARAPTQSTSPSY